MDEKTAQASPGWPAQFRLLADGRVFEKHSADIHAEKGMTCIDCHQASEVMGGGGTHAHERDAIKIACVDCHAAGKTATKEYGQLDPETQQIVAMRQLNQPDRKFVVSESGAAAYPNVFLDAGGHPVLSLMDSTRVLKPKPMAEACTAAIHQRLECSACHTPWTPQCISCHTSFDRNTQGWDYLAGKYVDGNWQEEPANYLSDAPALGIERISTSDGQSAERITTFSPGMILHLDLPGGSAEKRPEFRRLFAPASAHTTATHSRDCRSCHTNPAALGYDEDNSNMSSRAELPSGSSPRGTLSVRKMVWPPMHGSDSCRSAAAARRHAKGPARSRSMSSEGSFLWAPALRVTTRKTHELPGSSPISKTTVRL
jgi:hypothetical protein